MPIEIHRFGVGHRRPQGPPGTVGLTGQPIHADGRGVVAELAFARGARIEPHSNPNTTWLIVIEGGGWAGVGDEHTRVAAGDAVLWPADVLHTAWTEHSEMRAIVVEFAGPDDSAVIGYLEGQAVEVDADEVSPERRGVGSLAEHHVDLPVDPESGEPA